MDEWDRTNPGNRTAEADTNNGCSSFAATGSNYTTATAYTASNQVKPTSVQSATGTYIYDVAGNVINDGVNQYIYDLDGRICAVWSNYSSLGPMTQYVYDAEGRRVAKLKITSTASWPGTGLGNTCSVPVGANFTLTNQYLRGVSGDQDTELDGSGNWIHTNIFAGSGVQATYWNNAGTLELSYIFNDWLGTKRGQFSTGTVASPGVKQTSWQSDPFGDYMTPHGSGGDANELHLTGKEHDTESGNDYFGARYYSSPMGRFMSPDWSAKAEPVPYAKLGNPQTLNLYAFVGNNPVSHVDVDGHQTLGPDRFGCSEEQIGCDGRKDKPQESKSAAKLRQHIVGEINNFDKIVNSRVDNIISSVKSGDFMLSEDTYQNANTIVNAGADYESAAIARYNLEDSVGKELAGSIHNEVSTLIGMETDEGKFAMLGQISHHDYVSAPSKGANVVQWAVGKGVDKVLDALSSTFGPYIKGAASVVIPPPHSTEAHDDAVKQINQSFGQN